MPISIYPPILNSSQPAFTTNEATYAINFTLQQITSFEDIGHIQIRITRQSNNRSVIKTSVYPDGTIYYNASSINTTNAPIYSVNILRQDLIEPWQPGYLYKVQMRFGKNAMYADKTSFAEWKQQQIDQGAFSEWSTVMIIKAIQMPSIEIINAQKVSGMDVVSTQAAENNLTPEFQGICQMNALNKEAVDKYKFDLYDINENLIETSDWLQHNSKEDKEGSYLDKHRFKTVLTDGESYIVKYSIITINGYQMVAVPYDFVVSLTFLYELTGVELSVDSQSIFCKENACLNLYCTAEDVLNGNYVITRSSEKTNFSIWEELAYLAYNNQSIKNQLIYQDFTIESGIKYKYAIQLENAAGLRTVPVYNIGDTHYIDFEYSYLYQNGLQLKLAFNQSLSSFKHTTLRAKQDTLGDKYPHLVQNGNAYYAEFPISGLISFHMDEDQTFFFEGPDGYYFQNELVIPKDKFIEAGQSRFEGGATAAKSFTIDTNLSHNNIFIEKVFRTKVEEFLNDFNYKLYKSPTEGNIIIGLLNVSLTPNKTLGRMIFDFSATAYQVCENSLENLDKYNIIDIGQFTSLANDDITLSFGQIRGVYYPNSDIYGAIRQVEEISVGGGYKMSLKRVTSIWVEQYPSIDFTGIMLELQAKRADALEKGESVALIDEEIAEYERMKDALSGPLATSSILNINGSNVVVAPNKVYQLKEPITSLKLISAKAPIIINYVCELLQKEDESIGYVTSIDVSKIWGQISGIFTGTDSILKTYDFDYKSSETFRIFNPVADINATIYDSQGNRIVDATNYNVYKDINILEIIKQETQKQVEFIYKTKFNQIDIEGKLNDGNIYYSFNNLISFDIETDEGATLLVGKALDGSDAIEVKIGPSGRYVLQPLLGEVNYLALKHAQYCVINYKTLTTQMKKVRKGAQRARVLK